MPLRKPSAPRRRKRSALAGVVPADNKWFTRLVVAAAIVEVVEGLDLAYPKVEAQKEQDLAAARVQLEAES